MIGINHVGKKKERLANQMFQYSAVKGIAKNMGYQYCVPPSKFKSNADAWEEHQLFMPFTLETFSPLQIQWIDAKRPVLQEKQFHFDEELFNNCPDWVTLWGFFQSEKYFLNVRDELIKDFTFKDDIKNPCMEMMEGLNKSIALHVRRTDYAQYGHHPIVSLEYYEKALSYFDSDRPVVVLSDDPAWCHEQPLFADDRFMISESGDQFVDLCLMTMCSDFIIANSSFSWWGAWLSESVNKQVIAPSKWFGPPLDQRNNTQDLYCEGWMKL